MLRPRLIPCLLIQNGGLVKTIQFGQPKYIGDPLNAVRIFNEKQVDELMVIDIDNSRLGRAPNEKLIAELAAECRMPLCYGGGIKTVQQVERLISLGVEKVSVEFCCGRNTAGYYRGIRACRKPEHSRRDRCKEGRAAPKTGGRHA